jgi:hypothetical protein
LLRVDSRLKQKARLAAGPVDIETDPKNIFPA